MPRWVKAGVAVLAVALFTLAGVFTGASTGAFNSARAQDWHALSLKTGAITTTLSVEIADTPRLRNKGLMFREDLPPNHGMLFVFNNEARRSFWMKNTPLSLDILFFDAAGQFMGGYYATTPFSTESLLSPKPAQYALELKAGEAKRLGFNDQTMLLWPEIQ